MPEPDATGPGAVEVDREQGLTVTWPDGTASRFPLEELRVNCPCADCRNRRERGLDVWPTPTSPRPLRIVDAELVGAWGISLTWNDGHSTGIFSWAVLREWAAARDERLRFDVFGRLLVDVERRDGRWICWRIGAGGTRASLAGELAVPDELGADELPTYLADWFHELAAPGTQVRRL
ncbi:MAG: DUF971 domain-containing protein [Acidimicrobiia bacterium]|nr:DUF971 domain-containing protein [Acidimicrobiia bacterium]